MGVTADSELVDAAGGSVERERRGYGVGDAVPGAVEAESRVGSTGRNVFPGLSGLFAHRHSGAALRFGAIPGVGLTTTNRCRPSLLST